MSTKHLGALCACVSLSAWAAGGTISGTVSFEGTPPPEQMLKRMSDPVCNKTPMADPTITVKDGKLENVLVRVVQGAKDTPAPLAAVNVNQKDCMYTPRVQGAVQGQKVTVTNEDGTMHNVRAMDGQKPLFNVAQPPGAPAIEGDPKGAEVLKLKCDIHKWMAGYIVFNKNPYFAVTGADGKFELKGLPPGKYTLEAWHEKLGSKTAEVTVAEGKPARVSFAFAAAPAGK